MPLTARQLERLAIVVNPLAPTHGFSGEPGAVVIDFQASATAPQISAANAAVAAIDWSQSAQDLWEEQQGITGVIKTFAKRVATNVPNNTNALADVTGLTFQLKPNAHYVYSFLGAYTAVGTTIGISLAVNGPASPVLVRGLGCIAESATASRNGVFGVYNSPIAGQASGGATALPFWLDGNISTGAAGGAFSLRFASKTNNNLVTILAGSYGTLSLIG